MSRFKLVLIFNVRTFSTVHRRCLDTDNMEPRDRPLVCFASKIRLHEYNVGCCSNEELCNKNFTLEFVPKADDDDATLEGFCRPIP